MLCNASRRGDQRGKREKSGREKGEKKKRREGKKETGFGSREKEKKEGRTGFSKRFLNLKAKTTSFHLK